MKNGVTEQLLTKGKYISSKAFFVVGNFMGRKTGDVKRMEKRSGKSYHAPSGYAGSLQRKEAFSRN